MCWFYYQQKSIAIIHKAIGALPQSLNYKWWALEIPRNRSSKNPAFAFSPAKEGLALIILKFIA